MEFKESPAQRGGGEILGRDSYDSTESQSQTDMPLAAEWITRDDEGTLIWLRRPPDIQAGELPSGVLGNPVLVRVGVAIEVAWVRPSHPKRASYWYHHAVPRIHINTAGVGACSPAGHQVKCRNGAPFARRLSVPESKTSRRSPLVILFWSLATVISETTSPRGRSDVS
ncbi:hypothetical protein BDM02DRAFT_3125764 [Thelephora ganbajun]|uniref:Uncharacterized protein n=1 Tax=Thelephora ganbajun TaxID=370292 RepID=A0ACB6ZUR9_THEGA|nr:hypothetical protein BDM02DRAFT_3125764 [Thelephora ganbajun]